LNLQINLWRNRLTVCFSIPWMWNATPLI
jgi:hypothetical protein